VTITGGLRRHLGGWRGYLGALIAGALTVAVATLPGAHAESGVTPRQWPHEVALAPIVHGWGEGYEVSGAKSEPLYIEHISSTRVGDTFAVRIEVLAQGDTALGTQESAVRVTAQGRVEWIVGCTMAVSVCADDPALRGFLAPAAMLALQRTGRLPETGTARTLAGTPVVCIDDSALYPRAPAATTDLQPCFSQKSGALLGHYSEVDGDFIGSTLEAGLVDKATPSPDLLASILS
jgi:hypothetical protein